MTQPVIAIDQHMPATANALPSNWFRLASFLAKVRVTLWVRDRWLGLWWWLLQPMAMGATYVFMVRYAMGGGRPNHALFIMCALLPWTCFIAATNQASSSYVGNKNLLKSFRFNYLALPLAEVMAATFRFVCSLVVLGVLMMYYGISPTWNLLWIPFLLAVQFLFMLAVGYLLAICQVFIQDTPNAWQVLSRIWFYASPSLYSLQMVAGRVPEDKSYIYFIYNLNPFATLFTAYRDVVIEGVQPQVVDLGYVALCSSMILAVAILMVRRLQGVLPKHV